MDKLQLLYVDDQDDIRMIVEFALEDEADMSLKLAESGEQALEMLKEYTPDMILLDVMMPGIDGPTTLQAIRSMDTFKSTPIVFVTAKVQAHEVDALKKLGAQGVIIKPFDPLSLADQIRKCREGMHDR